MGVPDTRTVDGYDVQMQTNHLSHFLLTRLLFPLLEAAADARGEARIVQHSSGARGKMPGMTGSGMLEAEYMQPATDGSLGGNDIPACFNRYHQTKLANPGAGGVRHKSKMRELYCHKYIPIQTYVYVVCLTR